MDGLLALHPAEGAQGGVHQQVLHRLQYATEAVGQAVNQHPACNGGDIEQNEFHHAFHAGAPHPAEHDVHRHEEDGDQGRRQMADGAERICATTLMKMPMELSTLPQVSARGPYSRETICSKVEHPLCRRGAA